MRFVPGRFRLMPGALLLLALLTGCATQTRTLLQQTNGALSPRAELAQTPFYAQERYQCGPAALAMSLNAAGIAVTPEALVPQVYVPQREGSFQVEMLAAARRHGAVAMTIPPRLDALLTEVAAGNPVIVLQNLSLQLFPLWHYAVVIGYDLDRAEIVLRSGTTERLPMSMSTFEHTWARSAYWAMVALPPGRLPATVEQGQMVDALLAFEKTGDAAAARRAYQAALQRWPDNLVLQMGYGNSAYAAGELTTAAAAFRRAADAHPDSAPAFNNLASVLSELGRFEEARQAAQKALALGGPWRDASFATLQSIEAAERKGRAR
jgi:tetratricopeptide (TPR) repeat protein